MARKKWKKRYSYVNEEYARKNTKILKKLCRISVDLEKK
jgi:hypothetical protein